MKKKNWLFVIASIVMLVMVCLAFTVKTFQNDTFYTIKVGESIMENGIDMKDHFSWHELSYTYPHWLFDVLVYNLYKLGGFNGLYIANIVIFIGIALIFYFMNLKHNKSYFLSLLFSIMSIIMLARFITMRAQLITYLLFLLEVFFIENYLKKGSKGNLLGLIILCVVIANVHAAVWPLYFILMLPYIAEYFIALINNKIGNKLELGISNSRIIVKKNNYTKNLVILFIVCLPLGLLTPLGDLPYTYFIKTLMGNSMEYIDEHKPLILIENLFVIGYLAIMLVPLIFTKVKIKLADLFMICGLLLMTFMSIRHLALLAVIGMFYLCRLIGNIGLIKGREPLDYKIPWYGIFVVTVTMVITAFYVYNVNAKEEFVNPNTYPVVMVNWMKENLEMDKVRLYNEYDFGSYLIYKDIPVYIDSRSDLYAKEFNGKADIFEEYMNITSNYGRVFKKYEITHILIYKDTYLNRIISISPNYELVKREGRFMLYKYLGLDREESTEEEV